VYDAHTNHDHISIDLHVELIRVMPVLALCLHAVVDTAGSVSVIGASIGQLRTMKYITEDEAKEEVTVM
jgi:hypothetical protein